MAMSKPTPATTTTKDSLPIRPLDSRDFSMIQPLAGRGVLLRNYAANNGVITVSLRRVDLNADRFYCKVGDSELAATPPDNLNDLTGLTQLRRVGPGQIFQAHNVQITGIQPLAPSENNKWIGIGSYAANGAVREKSMFQFIAVPQTSTASVNARNCLFFAYTSDTVQLLYPPAEKFPECRPYKAAAPIDAAHVLISVSPDGNNAPKKWTHSGGQSGVPVSVPASGQVGDPDETDHRYVDSNFLSQNIKPLDRNAPTENLWEGLLTGMWDFGVTDGIPNATEVMSIGTGLGLDAALLLGVPQSSSLPVLSLRLGSHQELNWGVASGSLEVSLTWS